MMVSMIVKLFWDFFVDSILFIYGAFVKMDNIVTAKPDFWIWILYDNNKL